MKQTLVARFSVCELCNSQLLPMKVVTDNGDVYGYRCECKQRDKSYPQIVLDNQTNTSNDRQS